MPNLEEKRQAVEELMKKVVLNDEIKGLRGQNPKFSPALTEKLVKVLENRISKIGSDVEHTHGTAAALVSSGFKGLEKELVELTNDPKEREQLKVIAKSCVSTAEELSTFADKMENIGKKVGGAIKDSAKAVAKGLKDVFGAMKDWFSGKKSTQDMQKDKQVAIKEFASKIVERTPEELIKDMNKQTQDQIKQLMADTNAIEQAQKRRQEHFKALAGMAKARIAKVDKILKSDSKSIQSLPVKVVKKDASQKGEGGR